MELVNPLSAFRWDKPLEMPGGVRLMGIREKQGHAFSRHGYLAALEDPTLDPDAYGRMIRRTLRPLSAPTLERARAEYARREVVAFPRYFIIEPNASCNRKCVFCPIIVTNRKGNMKWDAFMRLMTECSQHDVYGISLYQLSEPMLWRGKVTDFGGMSEYHLDIADMVNAAKRTAGFRAVNISTNGDAPNLARLLECELDDLYISIDGTTADVYDQNRPSTRPNDTGAFQRTIDRVTAFLEAKAARGQAKPWVRLQIINNALCAPQVLDFVRHWITVPGVDDIYVKNLDGMVPWLGSAAVSAEESEIKMSKVATMPCQHLYAIGSMVATGSYTACCHDAKTELATADGHIDKMTFADWWNGSFMTELRAEHERGATRLPCKLCSERDPWL
jgi:wyosine [tRNA(Phe)-imidazoG37] synthetase (radical SAM superfamily)